MPAGHCIPNISVTLPLFNCSESTHYQQHIHYFYRLIDHNILPIMKMWFKEIWKFQFLYKWQDEATISWLYIGFSILMIGTRFYPKIRNIIPPCGSKHTFIVRVSWASSSGIIHPDTPDVALSITWYLIRCCVFWWGEEEGRVYPDVDSFIFV